MFARAAPRPPSAISCRPQFLRSTVRTPRYSTTAPATPLADIEAHKTVVVNMCNPDASKIVREKPLVFGRTFTDHMLKINWTSTKGWDTPMIVPFGPLLVHPAAPVFHYGLGDFEGMKAYIDAEDHIRLFRPTKNMERLYKSNQRLSLPTFSQENLLECLKEGSPPASFSCPLPRLLRLEKAWIPRKPQHSLYIRPTCVATGESLGVGPSNSAMLFVILSPVGPYYPEGFKPVRLLADEHHVRAWPGGTGAFKVGSNYAGTIAPQVAAAKQGCSQVLWLFGSDHQMTEAGTMNLFVFLKGKNGTKELVTPPLDSGLILHGITRDSILQLTRSWGEFKVSERVITMAEFEAALQEKRVLEVFGAGTAAIVSPIKGIVYKGRELVCPLDVNDPTAQSGPLATRLFHTILDIQYGKHKGPFSEWSERID